MKNFFKGLLGGIGNITPGVSGSALLMVVGVYENCITAIWETIRLKNIKKNIIYLFPILLGIAAGTFLFGNFINYLIDTFPVITSFIFCGLLIATIPSLFQEAKKKGVKKSYHIVFMIALLLGFSLLFLAAKINFEQQDITIFIKVIMGMIIALASIIPGISNTILLTIMGTYPEYINAVSSLDLTFLIPVLLGYIIGAFSISGIVYYLLKNYYSYTHYAILGFLISTIPAIIHKPLYFNRQLIWGVVIGLLTFVLVAKLLALLDRHFGDAPRKSLFYDLED